MGIFKSDKNKEHDLEEPLLEDEENPKINGDMAHRLTVLENQLTLLREENRQHAENIEREANFIESSCIFLLGSKAGKHWRWYVGGFLLAYVLLKIFF